MLNRGVGRIHVALLLAVIGAVVWFVMGGRADDTAGEPVVVLAAASLTDVLTAIGDEYELAHPGRRLELVFAGSSTLARQIEAGAPGDLFFSADAAWMAQLERGGHLAQGTRSDPLANELVVVGGVAAQDLELVDLGSDRVSHIALADPDAVPAGRYARESLERLGLWRSVRAKAVLASDVRVALAYAERDEVDAAVVYATDLAASEGVRLLTRFPDWAQPNIRYSLARLSSSTQVEAADAVRAYLLSPRAQAAFEHFGFIWRTGELSSAAAATNLPVAAAVSPADDWRVLRLSLLVAATAVLLCLPIGVLTGWLLARRDFFGKSVVESLANLPLVLPPAVTGFLLLMILGRQGPLGGLLYRWFGVQVAFTWIAAAIAAAAVSFPLLVQSVRLAAEAVDPELEAAARTLGAGPFRVATTITLPLAAPGIVAGAVIAFARALGELGATLVFAGNTPGQTQTIPLAVWTRVGQVGGGQTALRLVVISVVVSYLSLFLASRLQRRMLRRRRGLDP